MSHWTIEDIGDWESVLYAGRSTEFHGWNLVTLSRMAPSSWPGVKARIEAIPDMEQIIRDLYESSRYWSEYEVPIGIVERMKKVLEAVND